MLGPKEICGLMVLLCCSLAPKVCGTCPTYIRQEAKKLKDAAKLFFPMNDSATVFRNIGAQLPSFNDRSDRSSSGTHRIVQYFHALFRNLSAVVEDPAVNESLKRNIEQQRSCLHHWGVSPINIPFSESENAKIWLVKASERYNFLMHQNRVFRDETVADAAEGGR